LDVAQTSPARTTVPKMGTSGTNGLIFTGGRKAQRCCGP